MKDDSDPDHPMRDPASAAKLFAELRAADPLTALRDLSAWRFSQNCGLTPKK